MRHVRPLAAALACLLLAPACRAAPQGVALPDAPRLLASCTGRLSALLEHQWLMAAPEAEATEDLRARMLALLAAATDPAPAPDITRALLAARVEAKAAQAALLTRATFGTPSPRAARRARSEIARCRALLPD
ncbi:hypothetical protein KUV28_07430 [Ferrimonas balearica]|nr:hypothetical protein [Ferrimonas balearica]